MKAIYAVLAVVGAILPYLFFVDFFVESGVKPSVFLAGLFVNGAAGGFTVDLLLSSFIFWTYLISERVEKSWRFILINLTIGLSCALPFYLYCREQQKAAGRSADQLSSSDRTA